jgi:hypothetical protein
MLKDVVLAVALGAAAAPSSAQIYKCQENGRVVYSQQPCSESPQVLDIRRSSPRPGSFQAGMERREDYVKKFSDMPDHIRTAIVYGVAIPGMTEDQVLVAKGEPARRNLTQTLRMSRWQWVYRGAGGRETYVYIEDGIVVATN